MEKQKIEKALELFIRFCLYASILAPLILSAEFFFPAIFPKALYFRLLLEAAFVAYIPLAMIQPKFRPRFNFVYFSIAIFVLVVFLTSITGSNFRYSFWGNYERMDGIFSWIHYWFFILISASVLKQRKDWMKLFGVSLFVAVLMSVYGFLQRAGAQSIGPLTIYETNMGRITGTIANPIFLAVYLLFNIVFGLIIVVNSQIRAWWRILALAAVIPIASAYIMTGSRGAYVGLVIGIFLFVVGSIFWTSDKKFKKWVVAGFLIFLAITGILYGFKNQSEWIKSNFGRFFSIGLKDPTIQTRLISWKGSLVGISENPILGVGPQRFDLVFNKYFDPRFYTLVGNETWWDRAHNMVLEVVVTMGIVGLAAYIFVGISLIYVLFMAGRKESDFRREVLILFGFLAAYFIQNLFVFDTVSSYIVLSVIIGYIIARTDKFDFLRDKFNIEKLSSKLFQNNFVDKLPRFWFAGLILAFLFVAPVAYACNIKLIKHNRLLLYNLSYINSKSFSSEMEDYRKIVSISDFDIKEVAIKIGQYLGDYSLANKMPVGQFRYQYSFAIQTFDKAYNQNSKDARLLLTFGNMLNIYGEILKQVDAAESKIALQKAEKILKEAVELGRSRQQVYYSLANTYIVQGDYRKGIEVLEDAVAINTNTPTSHWILSMAYSYAGEKQKAIASAEKAIDNGYAFQNEKEADHILSILIKEGNLDLLLKIYKKLVEDIHTGALQMKVAEVLAQMGLKEEAISEAEKVIKLDPSLKKQVADFIQKVQKGGNVDFLGN